MRKPVPLLDGRAGGAGVDVAATAPGIQHYYYLGTHGCPDACRPCRVLGGLGESSTGPRLGPGSLPDTMCR